VSVSVSGKNMGKRIVKGEVVRAPTMTEITRKEGDMPNSTFETDNVNGSVPTAAADSIEQPTNSPEGKLYEVSVVTSVLVPLKGRVIIYATDEDEAVDKVRAKIDAETLDDDLVMEDDVTGCTMTYGDVTDICDVDFQTDGVELVAEVLAQYKALLESMLNEGDDEQVVSA
jgi:hypothetical protein